MREIPYKNASWKPLEGGLLVASDPKKIWQQNAQRCQLVHQLADKVQKAL